MIIIFIFDSDLLIVACSQATVVNKKKKRLRRPIKDDKRFFGKF